MFLGYDCAISRKSENKIVEVFRKSKFHRWTGKDIYRIAEEFNPKTKDGSIIMEGSGYTS
jgi:hypothetical protein